MPQDGKRSLQDPRSIFLSKRCRFESTEPGKPPLRGTSGLSFGDRGNRSVFRKEKRTLALSLPGFFLTCGKRRNFTETAAQARGKPPPHSSAAKKTPAAFAAGVFPISSLPYGVRPSQTALSAGEPLRPGFMTISPLPMAFTGQTRAQRWQPTHLLWSQEGLRFSSSQEMAWCAPS